MTSPAFPSKRGGAAPYRQGAAFERLVQTRLGLLGYATWRVAGSRGPADVVALRPGEALLVQAKKGGEFTHQTAAILSALATSCGAVPCFAWSDHGVGCRILRFDTQEELG